MAYNPYKEFTPSNALATLPYTKVDRQPTDKGEDWQYHARLIANVLNHYEEVADCSVDADGQTIYVVLPEGEYDADRLKKIDTHVRQAIGRVVCFNYNS